MMEDTRQEGFTLIELMVAMAISGMLMAVVVMAFTGQSRSNNSVQDVTSLQQDLRSALQLMASEIRMAGYDPTGKAGAGIIDETHSGNAERRFKINTNGDVGDEDCDDPDENIYYATYVNGDGISCLGRKTGNGNFTPIAENIDQLAYEYFLDDETWTQAPVDLTKIRAVKIVILGHSARSTAGAVDTSTFIPPLESVNLDWTPATPGNFHWRMMSLIVQCRNLSIKA